MAMSKQYITFGSISILAMRIQVMSPYKCPLSRADKVPRTAAGYRITDGNIAAIDFGTTSVSMAYATKGDDKVSTLILDSEERSTRVPNAVLLKKGQGEVTVEAFGNIAKNKFASLRPSDHKEHVYFERIKMLMKRDKFIDRQTLVESFSGEKFYLVEVIAFILKYLKDLLIAHFSRTVKPMKTTDFDWVITVPAIWDARGKRMMREAAYLAGLLTGSGGINRLTGMSYCPLPVPSEVNPDKLSLALEPESAALYSQETVGDQIEGDKSRAAICRPTEYMVIDIGGGTVDITAHIEVEGGIVVENIPTGNAWGGTKINEAFSEMLQDIVSDPGFSKFLASGDRSQSMSVLNKIIYREFETQKLLFGQVKTKEISIDLPNKFVNFYNEALEAGVKKRKGIEYEDDTIYVSESVVESQLFCPTLDGIIKCTLEAIEENDGDLSTFYLVGGFGGCKYVHEKVTAAIEKAYNSKGRSCTVLVPPTPQLAVATGAVMWRKNPEKIKARRSDATYGIAVGQQFDSTKHDSHYKYYDKDREENRCGKIFCVFLEKSELANAEEVITTSLSPYSQATVQSVTNIYSTPNLGVQYIEDKKGESTVTKIGQLVIDIPNPDNLPLRERLLDVTMDFSGTEIQAKAKYRVTGKEVKTVCDFLSTQ